MDELLTLLVAVILVAVLFGFAVLALVGSVVVGVLFLVLAAISFLSGVIHARREDHRRVEELIALGCLREDAERQTAGERRLRKRKARDSNPEGN